MRWRPRHRGAGRPGSAARLIDQSKLSVINVGIVIQIETEPGDEFAGVGELNARKEFLAEVDCEDLFWGLEKFGPEGRGLMASLEAEGLAGFWRR